MKSLRKLLALFFPFLAIGCSKPDASKEAPPTMPWDQRPSIYDHVRAHTDPTKPGLKEGGETLPDEPSVNEGSKIRWAPGAMDGVLGHHMGAGEDGDQLVRKAVELVLAYCRTPTAKAKASVYQHILEGNTLPLIDPIIESIVATKGFDQGRLYELAESFVKESPDREPVKFGIAILGIFRNPENEVLFQTLGRHEEFTLFCAVALSNLNDDPEPSLFELGQNVDGWGRIHVVERLAKTENPRIKDWLLREGYRNSVMYEYLAYTCATSGGLLGALSEDTVDREMLTSGGEIISALITGGPAEDIDNYEVGALVVEKFLSHMEKSAETIDDLIAVHTIKTFVDHEDADWTSRAERGWTDERRVALRDSCTRILGRPNWPDLVRRSLTTGDDMTFYRANEAAIALGLDTWDTHWRRLKQKPTDSGRWYQVMASCNAERVGDVVAFAEENINLAEIATGPADEIGLGRGWEQHSCLDCVLQELRKFPGHGHQLIQSGLRSPVVRNRNMAVAAMAAWGDEKWGKELCLALEAAVQIEPNEGVRERMEKALRGETTEE